MLDETARRVEIILSTVAAEFRMTVERMIGPGRQPRAFAARVVAQAALLDYTTMSQKQVIAAIGRRWFRPSPINPLRRHPGLPEKLKRVAAQLLESGLDPKPCPPPKPRPTSIEHFPIDAVLSVVCAHFKVDRFALCGEVRTQSMIIARVGAIYALRTLSRLSTTQIGAVLRRDHSTVVYHLRPRQAAKYPWMAGVLRDMETQLRAPVIAWQQGVPRLEQNPAISTAA